MVTRDLLCSILQHILTPSTFSCVHCYGNLILVLISFDNLSKIKQILTETAKTCLKPA